MPVPILVPIRYPYLRPVQVSGTHAIAYKPHPNLTPPLSPTNPSHLAHLAIFNPSMPKGYPIRTSELTHPLITKGNIWANAESLGFTLPSPDLVSKAKLIPLYVAGIHALPQDTRTTPNNLAPTFPHLPSSACASLGIMYPHKTHASPSPPTIPTIPSAACTSLGITY